MPTPIYTLLRDLPINKKLLVAYFSIFSLTLLIGSSALYSQVKNAIETNIEEELQNSTQTILSMVQTAARVSIKNHLRAVAEQNRQILENIHEKQRRGAFTEQTARARAAEIIMGQNIGKTGYIYCIDSQGIATVHPKPGMQGRVFLQQPFVREQIQRKEGYLEYEWKNPSETTERPKALYMTYFEPWDWIISVSSYRDEFSELIAVSDFRDSILDLRFGETGYSFIINSDGKVIVHPLLAGSAYDFADLKGHEFIRTLCELKKGKLIYSWKNPGERKPRDKLVIFNYIPEYDWIVASSCYLEESYAPLARIRNVILATVLATLVLTIPITWLMSVYIVRPMKTLMQYFRRGANGDLSVRMSISSVDEMGQLGGYFNYFMEKLQHSKKVIVEEMREREQAEAELRVSEEKYRTILQRMEEGYYEVGLDGRFTFFNASLEDIMGYSREVLDGLDIRDIATEESYRQILETFREIRLTGKSVKTTTCALLRGDGTHCLLEASVAPVFDQDGGTVGYSGVLKDITDKNRAETEARRLERDILDISESEHRRIGRTLHDDLCPHLLGVEVLSDVLRKKLVQQSLPESESVAKIQALIQDSIRKMKRLSRGLYPVDFSGGEFDAAIADLVAQTQEIFSVPCRFQCDFPVSMSEDTAAIHAYYIAHEALYNAVKHAKAQHILVTLAYRNGHPVLTVEDDGVGMPDKQTRQGMGVRIMAYRARRIGAPLTFTATPSGGTTVTLEMQDTICNETTGE